MLQKFYRKLDSLLLDKKFSEILTGSVFALLARVTGVSLGLVTSILVARFYGAEMMGVLAIVQAFMMMATIFAVLGTNVSILRLIPEHLSRYSPASAFGVYRKTQYLVVVASLLVGAGLFLFSEQIAETVYSKPQFSFYIAITAVCVIFRALMDLNTQAIRGFRLIRTFSFMQVFPSSAMLIILLLMIVFSRRFNDPVYAQLGAWVISSILGLTIMNRIFRRKIDESGYIKEIPASKIISISCPMLMTASINFFIGQVGVLILGIFSPAEEVGYYSVAVKLATLTAFLLQAINSMAAPKFAELYHLGHIDDLFYIAKKSTKLIFFSTLPFIIILSLFGKTILSKIYGINFVVVYPAMIILMIGRFISSISGSTGHFMNMTGRQKELKNIVFISALLNIVLCFTLIPKFGANGAAAAGMISGVSWNLYTLFYIKKSFGKTIGYLPFYS